jgi:peptidoglycan endopeptidase LytF
LRHPHADRQVTIFIAGRQAVFNPVRFGRYQGHRFDGVLRPTAAELAALLSAQGLDPAAAPMLAATSRQEGGFDALNTYDRARVSWGFIQFSGTGGLPRLLARLKAAEPERFARYFGAAGLDIDSEALIVRAGDRDWRGWQALTRIHDEPTLWKPFLLAAHDPAVQAAQVRAAYESYWLPAQAIAVRAGGQTQTLGELFAAHPMGQAAAFDRAVFAGLRYTHELFQRAARQVGRLDAAAIVAAARQLESDDHARWQALADALAARN